jgi:hypothetical protein
MDLQVVFSRGHREVHLGTEAADGLQGEAKKRLDCKSGNISSGAISIISLPKTVPKAQIIADFAPQLRQVQDRIAKELAGAMKRDVAAPVNVDYGSPLPNQGLSGSEHDGLASSKPPEYRPAGVRAKEERPGPPGAPFRPASSEAPGPSCNQGNQSDYNDRCLFSSPAPHGFTSRG